MTAPTPQATAWQCGACEGRNPAGTRFCGHCGAPAHAGSVRDEAPDERRLVTALFADISGFTSLADRLDADDLHEVISPVISRLAAVAERYGGFVAKYAGDALLVFFGAPVAMEDHAERALRVALEMHGELGAFLPEMPEDARHLELHIGVNSGRVVAGMFGGDLASDYSILGDAVNVAQRLESVAPPGATYAGETTVRLTEAMFEFVPLGELSLKGKSRTIPGWSLVGERTATQPRPPSEATLVGRDAEIAVLRRALDETVAGRGPVVVVLGEPGVGKSRLTEALRTEVVDAGGLWLEGRSVAYGATLPYWPYVDLLRRAFDITVDLRPAAALERLRSGLAAAGVGDAVPYFARVLGVPDPGAAAAMEPEAFQRAFHDGMVRWITGLARQRSVVVSLEDVHWSDGASLNLTRQLAHASAGAGFLVVATGRPESADALAEVAGGPGRARIVELGPLGPEAWPSLVGAVLGGDAAPDAVAAIGERSGGNPFFMEELVRSLAGSGVLHQAGERWRLRDGWDSSEMPATVEGVLSARIDLLPPTTASVLQQASVIGRRVRGALLRAVARQTPDVGAEIERLVRQGFLDRVNGDGEESLVFHHALVLDTAYSRLLRRQRRDLHMAVADAAETLYGDGDDVVDLMARHLYLGGAGRRAVTYLLRAGERARNLFANDEAMLHLSRAVEVVRDEPDLAPSLPDLLLDLADLKDLTGRYDDAYALYREARDQTGALSGWRGMAAMLRKRGEARAALEVVDEAFRALPVSAHQPTGLWLERTWALVVEGRYLEAVEAAEAGLSAADGEPGPVEAQLLLQLTRAKSALGVVDEALAHGQRALRIFDAHEDLRGQIVALQSLGEVYSELERLDEAASCLALGVQLATRIGSAEEIAGCLVNLGMVELRRGNLPEAIACDRRALDEVERTGYRAGQAIVYANLAEKVLEAGDVDEALRYCERAIALAAAVGNTWTLADAHRTLSRIRHVQGLYNEAAAQAEQARALFSETGDTQSASQCLDFAAKAAAEALGDPIISA